MNRYLTQPKQITMNDLDKENRDNTIIYKGAELISELIFFTVQSMIQSSTLQGDINDPNAQLVVASSQSEVALIEQFEPFICQIMIDSINNEDEETMDAYTRCLNSLVVGANQIMKGKMVKLGKQGGGSALQTILTNPQPFTIINPPQLPVKIQEVFQSILNILTHKSEYLDDFIPTIEAISQTQIINMINNPSIIIPLFNTIRDHFSLDNVTKLESNQEDYKNYSNMNQD
ncbi:MAG: hypothetical protein EZS28_050796 [Streblomastix strix]|uniref:Uncharacterized protein n=1 Tax=Streblomastix strix TaxID=222440 RepID=A0A5J4T607_9EUKA|nr:MAG: hypothetical protein EZS28_050796 [Streblomastix strix]